MKTTRNNMKTVIMTLAFFLTANMVLAVDEINEVYTSGSSVSAAGDYIVEGTNETFYFQGDVFNVYKVNYENASMNTSIAVNSNGEKPSFVAIGKDYIIFYESTAEGFGVRKVKFSNPDAHKRFDVMEFKDQTILMEAKDIDKKEAIDIIAAKLPAMKS